MSETHIALCSGGKDSIVATHAAMRFGPAEAVMYLDTTTGIQENREFVREFCDEYGWHLIEWRTPENYEDLVKKYGFPGPSKHSWFYQYLKERQISKLATFAGEVHYWTGVHKQESANRMENVVEEGEDQSGRWHWHAPMANWSADDFDRYRERFDLPENPLWSTLGRSGDCYCGAYGNRMELIDLDAIDADRGENLRELENSLDVDKCGFDDERRAEWAWHDDDKSAWAMDDDDQMRLCSHCGVEYPMPDGGEKDEE